ncbi:hypothetical protein PI126_g21937 [Phytophthora idaei]|nr:hypothetical protein PI126_g21937 [Phytophthora idaei]
MFRKLSYQLRRSLHEAFSLNCADWCELTHGYTFRIVAPDFGIEWAAADAVASSSRLSTELLVPESSSLELELESEDEGSPLRVSSSEGDVSARASLSARSSPSSQLRCALPGVRAPRSSCSSR